MFLAIMLVYYRNAQSKGFVIHRTLVGVALCGPSNVGLKMLWLFL